MPITEFSEEQQRIYNELRDLKDSTLEAYYEVLRDMALVEEHASKGHNPSRLACPVCI